MMATTAVPTTTMTIRLPREMRARFEALAKATGRNRNALAQEAIRRFIETEEWQIAEIQAGLREAEAGTLASEGEMGEGGAEVGGERRRVRGEGEDDKEPAPARHFRASAGTSHRASPPARNKSVPRSTK